MAELALVLLLGLCGPLLALPRRFGIPVALGELLVGVIFGASGFHLINSNSPNLQLFTQLGFALVMMITASHIDVHRFTNGKFVGKAVFGALLTSAVALALAYFIGQATHLSSQWLLFAVLMASSSAAVVMPSFDGEKGKKFNLFITQVAFADLASIVVLPLVEDPSRLVRVATGALLISASAAVLFFILKWLNKTGRWKAMRKLSAQRGFGLELRISLILLLSLIWLAQSFMVTILIAGFGLGLSIGANGFPRRLAKQLFAVSEGLFSPIFFVLLGASINFSALVTTPALLWLGLLLGFGALAAHLTPMVIGVPGRYAVASSAQLGVPAAAVSIGLAHHNLSTGEAAAVMLAAAITLVGTAIAVAARRRT